MPDSRNFTATWRSFDIEPETDGRYIVAHAGKTGDAVFSKQHGWIQIPKWQPTHWMEFRSGETIPSGRDRAPRAQHILGEDCERSHFPHPVS